MDPSRQRIGRIVAPAGFHPQPFAEIEQRAATGAGDFVRERGADLLLREEILSAQKIDHRADQGVADGVAVRNRAAGRAIAPGLCHGQAPV